MITINGNPILINGNFISDVSYITPMNPYTLRLKFKDGFTPRFSKGTGVQVSSSPNIWDLTYENSDWSRLLYSHEYLLEVINANTTGVTNMSRMFYYCTSLTSVQLFDTSNVTDMSYMFEVCLSLTSVPLFDTSNVTSMKNMFASCTSLTTVPLFDTSSCTNMSSMFQSCSNLTTVPLLDTSKVTNMSYMLNKCYNVQSGALALYQQASTQTTLPSHYETFLYCGRDTTTGAAELAQIPSSWGGTGA